jgi:hypothetical protein
MPPVPVAPHQGGFGAVRRHDYHTGVDLYVADGTPLIAIEAGYVVKLGLFTGANVGTPWWNETWAVLIEGAHGGICYGEIQAEAWLRPGVFVQEGALLGIVRQVLRTDKGLPTSMLHVEQYRTGYRGDWAEWALGLPQPEGLMDPTSLLLECVESAQAAGAICRTPLPRIRRPDAAGLGKDGLGSVPRNEL